MFGGMADLAKTFGGEQSTAYKAMFAVSKGFAIANAALQLQTAIANAMALPFPSNLPAIAQAVSLGGQVVSAISGATYGGGRRYGGPVNPGSMYQVNESGNPEMMIVITSYSIHYTKLYDLRLQIQLDRLAIQPEQLPEGLMEKEAPLR